MIFKVENNAILAICILFRVNFVIGEVVKTFCVCVGEGGVSIYLL